MVEIYTEELAGIEVLHAVPAGKKNKALSTVVFYHGFTSSKLVYSYFAVALAQAGYRVIMPDADKHGSRFHGDEQGRLQQFWSILKNNIDEFSSIQRALVEQNLIAEGRLAVGGASMGGMTALGIMARHPEVRCVACLMGSGYFMQLAKTLFPPLVGSTPEERQRFADLLAPLQDYDIGHQLERIGNRPLLLWHGQEDDVVPAAETQRLQHELMQHGLDKNLTCLWSAGVKHRITPEALDATAQFLTRNL